MFRATSSPFQFNFRTFYQVLNYIYIRPCLSLQDLSEYMYFCMKILCSSRTFVKDALKLHVSGSPKPVKFTFQTFYQVLNYIYILPCLSSQDLSEYIYFCINFLNSSRTFVKKSLKNHVSCTSSPLNSISERSIRF